MEIFPGEKELCSDFANGMFTACFSLGQFIAPYFSNFANNYMGYERTGTFFAFIFSIYFCAYWMFSDEKTNYKTMIEENEHNSKDQEMK